MTARRPIVLSWRAYGNQSGGRWRVDIGVRSFEYRSFVEAEGEARAQAKRLGRPLDIQDRPSDEQLAFPRTGDQALSAAVADVAWAELCDEAIAKRAATGAPFQAFDLVADGLAEPLSPNAWGARFRVARVRGLIEQVNFGTSARPTSQSSALRVWRGTTAAQAFRETA